MQISIFPILGLLAQFGLSIAFDLQLVLNNRSVNPLDFLIPTAFSENPRCRNDSLRYREELSKFTVWATDMFDASTKFPSGIFSGSIYDTGNFDECVRARIPGDNGFSGQHCMAHFKIAPLDGVAVKKDFVDEYYEYERIFNITTWHKVAKYAHEASKQSRDEMYFTFCIPSSCSYQDLESTLKGKINSIKNLIPVSLEVDVDEMFCHVKREYNLTEADFIFIGVVGVFIFFGVLSTIYHLLTKLEDLEQFKLTGKAHDVLKAFSYSHIIKKIASDSTNKEGMDCIHGLKVISMFFIIMGHRIMFHIGTSVENSVFIESLYERVEFSMLTNGTILVDTFFTISGFLASYLTLQEINKRKKMVNVFMLYLHRLIRMTPSYAVVLAFYCTIFVQLGEGPFWEKRILVEQERCIESWWANLLYINNYVNIDKMCMFQSWYLTCDMHYFLVVPFLAYLLWKKPKAGFLICTILTLLSIVIHFLIIYMNQEDPFLLLFMKMLRDPIVNKSFQTIYIPSHMRISPYLVGILAGFVKFKIGTSEFKIARQSVKPFWVFGLTIAFSVLLSAFIFYSPTENKNYTLYGFYGALHHFLWSVCISSLIVMVSEKHGQWVAPYLNWKPWILLSRITYNAFLCHGAVQLYTAGILRSPVYVGVFSVLYAAAADIVFAYVIAFCLTSIFESPIFELERMIFKKQMHTSKSTEEGQESDMKKQSQNEVRDIYIPRLPSEISWSNNKF